MAVREVLGTQNLPNRVSPPSPFCLMCPAGEMTFFSDASYRGSFKGNKFHGFGRYEWNDGATYEGGWRENK